MDDIPFPDGDSASAPVAVVRGDLDIPDEPIPWQESMSPGLEDHVATFLTDDNAPVLGGSLPSMRQMLSYFGSASPAASTHGLTDEQSKAAILQLCGCRDKHISGVVGVKQSSVAYWTTLPGWRAFQRDVLDHSLTRLVGLAHMTIVQSFLNTPDEKERVRLAKYIIETSGVHSKPTAHVHQHEHSIGRATEREMGMVETVDALPEAKAIPGGW